MSRGRDVDCSKRQICGAYMRSDPIPGPRAWCSVARIVEYGARLKDEQFPAHTFPAAPPTGPRLLWSSYCTMVLRFCARVHCGNAEVLRPQALKPAVLLRFFIATRMQEESGCLPKLTKPGAQSPLHAQRLCTPRAGTHHPQTFTVSGMILQLKLPSTGIATQTLSPNHDALLP